jgi:hypothetical protein
METDLQKHFKKIYGDDNPKDIQEVLCDQFKMNEIKESDKAYLDKFQNAELLSFNDCGLKNLNNLPNISNLEEVNKYNPNQ